MSASPLRVMLTSIAPRLGPKAASQSKDCLLHWLGATANVRDCKRRGRKVQQVLAGCPLMSARALCFHCGGYGVGVECAQVRAGFSHISRVGLCQVPVHTIGKSLR